MNEAQRGEVKKRKRRKRNIHTTDTMKKAKKRYPKKKNHNGDCMYVRGLAIQMAGMESRRGSYGFVVAGFL